jgi:hypothetical protein
MLENSAEEETEFDEEVEGAEGAVEVKEVEAELGRLLAEDVAELTPPPPPPLPSGKDPRIRPRISFKSIAPYASEVNSGCARPHWSTKDSNFATLSRRMRFSAAIPGAAAIICARSSDSVVNVFAQAGWPQ